MTAAEQLNSWAAAPGSELFVGAAYGDRPFAVLRMNAVAVAEAFLKVADTCTARVGAKHGVTCVSVEGRVPGDGRGAMFPRLDGIMPIDAHYRVVIAPLESFAR